MEFGTPLGYGLDGVVWKVRMDNRIFALKVFWEIETQGGYRYYAIQRECHNVALLQMIQSSVQGSTEPVYLKPEPKGFKDAVINLKAFSNEGRQIYRGRPDAIRLTSTPRLRQCFGWTTVSGEQLHSLPRQKRLTCVSMGKNKEIYELRPTETYYAIVYELVTPCKTGAAKVQELLDFLHLAGFALRPE